MRLIGSALVLAFAGTLVAPPGHVARAAGCGATGTPTLSVYLPNVTKTLGGPAGWVTPFIVQNVGAAATTLEVSFYGFGDGSLVTCRSVPGIAPGTSFADVPNDDADLPDNGQFAVVVRSFGSQVVSVVNEQQGSGDRAEALSYVGLSQGSLSVALPYVAREVAGWTTTFVIQDLGTADAFVTASFVSADGARTATLTRTVGPGRAQFVDPRVEAALVSGTEYSVVLTSTQPIAAIVNAHNDAATVLHPMGFSYNGVPSASLRQVYLPYVARTTDGIGRQTRIVVQNAGSVDATPSLTFQKLGGGPPVIISPPAPVKAGRSWSFDPRFAADGTPCPAAGSATCIAEGEHSLAVSGGLFAPVAIVTSPATAMGYTGSVPSPARVYLPNVTRTLGGASGWTTPILLQSAGATSATLRWYRFADGSLAQTQTIAGLTAGAALRVDPRGVAGLAEATQYAVVVDAPGPIVAVVTELNSLGGDGAAIYEGFASTASTAPIPTTVTIGTLSFQKTATASADVYVETTIGDADSQTIVALVDPAVAYLQTDFARAFTTRPVLYAFATLADVQAGWSSVLGATGAPPSSFSGVFIGGSKKIALNWQAMKTARPYRTPRHELTHMLEHQVAGTGSIPTWLDEGLARFEDLSEPGGLYRTAESRYDTGSAVLTGTLQNVVSLTADQFYALGGSAESYAYYESAETVRLLRADLTQAGLVRILELIGQGQSFTAAYATVAGRSWDTFLAARTSRLQALAPAAGIATATDTFLGSGLTYLVYGLSPNATVTLAVTGPGVSGQSTGTADAHGVYEGSLGTSWPAATYTFTATSGATTLTTTGVKTTSVVVSFDMSARTSD